MTQTQQESAAVLLKVKTDTGDENATPALGTGTTDTILGLAYGYEGRKWYRRASLRYRRKGENDAGPRRGDKTLFDLLGGIRPSLTGYLDTWTLEGAVQVPVVQDLNGTALENDYIVRAGVRFNF